MVRHSEFRGILRNRNAGGGLVLAFDLSQLIMQARSFGARRFSFGSVLDSADASHRVEDLGHGSALAVTDMFELVGVIVLVQSMGLTCVTCGAAWLGGSGETLGHDQIARRV